MPGSCAFSGVAAVHGLPMASHPPAVASRQTARRPINGFPRLDQSLASSCSREAYPTTRTRGSCSVAHSFETPSSCRAFPGWRSEEIYRALTEVPLSVGARRALERTARTMGAREGTRPEDDPFTQALSRKAETRGRMDAVAAALRARGIKATSEFSQDDGCFARHTIETLMAAALACTDEGDFRRRIGEAAE